MEICYLCNETTDDMSAHVRKSHQKTEVYDCPHPGCTYSSKYPHRVRLHNAAIHHKYKKFACPMCTHRSSQKSDLARHLRKHTKETPYQCSVCDKAFVVKSYFKHLQRAHPEKYAEAKPYKCVLCDARYVHKITLKKHMVVCSLNLI